MQSAAAPPNPDPKMLALLDVFSKKMREFVAPLEASMQALKKKTIALKRQAQPLEIMCLKTELSRARTKETTFKQVLSELGVDGSKIAAAEKITANYMARTFGAEDEGDIEDEEDSDIDMDDDMDDDMNDEMSDDPEVIAIDGEPVI